MQRAAVASTETSLFVGRAEELLRLRRAVRDHRLVTVVGPSGIGKSRLLRKYVISRRADPGSILMMDLCDVPDVDAMIAAIVIACGGERTDDAMRTARRVLRARGELLLVLDNVEPLLPLAALAIEQLLGAAPELKIICGSREVLGVDEVVLELSGLEEERAADLISDRMHAAGEPRPIGRLSLLTLARKLGGVPLAIELAAARFGQDGYVVFDRLVGLPERFDDARSVRRAVDRAWTLLPEDDRELLIAASVCRGGISLDRLVAISELGPRASSIAIALSRRGLFEIVEANPIRLVMAESVRAHAEEVLESSGRRHALQMRHLRSFECAPAGALDRENMRAAIAFAVSEQLFDVALRMLLTLDDPSRDLRALDACITSTRDPLLLSRALTTRANILHATGRLTESKRDASTALFLARGDESLTAIATRALANAHFQLGELPDARQCLDDALQLERNLGRRGAVSQILQSLGAVVASMGDLELARIHYENALALAVEGDDPHAEARATIGLGSLWLEIGDLTRARNYYECGLQQARALHMTRTARIVTGYLGILELDAGRLHEAEGKLRIAAVASGDAGDLRVEGFFEGVRGAVLARLQRVDESRYAFESAEAALTKNRFFADVVAIHRGHLDLALGDGERARSRALQGREAALLSDDARIALRILERALDSPELDRG